MENISRPGCLLTGREVQPRSAAAADETIEMIGPNPAEGMGEKSDNGHCQNSEGVG